MDFQRMELDELDEIWESYYGIRKTKDVNGLTKIMEKLKKLHKKLTSSNATYIFFKEDVEKLMEAIDGGADTWGEGDLVKLEIKGQRVGDSDKIVDIFPKLVYIRSVD